MTEVQVAGDNIITSLGFTTAANMKQLASGRSGITPVEDSWLSPDPFFASCVDTGELTDRFSALADPRLHTRFEQLVLCSLQDALAGCHVDIRSKRTLFILATTKGNVELLDDRRRGSFERERLYLWNSARLVQRFHNMPTTPLVVSNACISGLLGIIIGTRMIRSGAFDNVIVTGADVLSPFIVSGFTSFMALSKTRCRPFDRDRDGLSLGEGAGTLILTRRTEESPFRSAGNGKSADRHEVFAGAGFSTNDANHISGPSRTGEGLVLAIRRCLESFGKPVDHISAHGTGTPYNDEMEAIAFNRTGLAQVPANSLKGFWGHTLGAAGVMESVAAIHEMKNNLMIGTIGFHQMGVTQPVNVTGETRRAVVNNCLKVASGFGGCNAAIIFYR